MEPTFSSTPSVSANMELLEHQMRTDSVQCEAHLPCRLAITATNPRNSIEASFGKTSVEKASAERTSVERTSVERKGLEVDGLKQFAAHMLAEWSSSEAKLLKLARTISPASKPMIELQFQLNRLHLATQTVVKCGEAAAATVRQAQHLGNG